MNYLLEKINGMKIALIGSWQFDTAYLKSSL